MPCPRCQHENRPQATFCEACASPLTANPSGPTAPSYAEITSGLSEALEREQATGAILRVIASSPTTVEPVFDAILDSALRLCASPVGNLHLFDGETFRLAAHRGMADGFVEAVRGPHRLGPHTGPARAVAERRPIHILDMMADRAYEERDPIRVKAVELLGTRTALFVPMLKEGTPIGVLVIWRREVRAYSESQIQLLSTFADQAVIAIENVRLFNETKEALEQQTATAEILRVISSSPTDVQPVFDAIAASAVRLCDGLFGAVYQFDGQLIHFVAHDGWTDKGLEAARRAYPRAPSRETQVAMAILDRAVVEVRDFENDPGVPEVTRALARALGYRSDLVVPMLREGHPIGAIVVARVEAGPFSVKQIELLKTFAAQAVIAIENVRLFNETKEALERQTATSEILRVIASSPTNTQPVFETIAQHAVRICDARQCTVFRFDGTLIHLVAHHHLTPEALHEFQGAYPLPLDADTMAARAIRDRTVLHSPDLLNDPEASELVRRMARAGGYRSLIGVPMLRSGDPIGVIGVTRSAADGGPRPFSDKETALLRTFADQAVIAIENVRLFTQLGARNQELTGALARQTATSEILQVIGRSPTDVQPVFEAIVRSASRLLGGAWTVLTHVREGALHLAAHELSGMPDDAVREWLRSWPRALDDESPVVVAVRSGQMRSVADAQTDPQSTAAARATAVATGHRCFAIMPMLKDGQGIGGIHVARPAVGPFTDVELALLRTFADQAVIAIENVRLFQELEARNRELTESLEQQTATGEILRVISRSPTDLQPVLDAVAENAARVCGAADSHICLLEGDVLRVVAIHGEHRPSVTIGDTLSATVATISGRVVCERRAIHIHDFAALPETEYTETQRHIRADRTPNRTQLAVPLLREGVPLGSIVIRRHVVQPFSAKQIALLETFADQAVIAIENVRLFNETKEALEQQTATGEILRVISSSPADLQPMMDAVAESAARLCGADNVVVYRSEGGFLRVMAVRGRWPTVEMPIGRGVPTGRAVLDRETVHVPDLSRALDEYPEAAPLMAQTGSRAILVAPLLRKGEAVGTITIRRDMPGPFTHKQIKLLETFAAQAVIAIENVRLFTELQEKNRALTDAHAQVTETLEQQTATSEVLKVISRSTFDLQPVLDTLIESAVRLCGANSGLVYRQDGDLYRVVVACGTTPAFTELAKKYPMGLNRESATGRAILDRRVVHIPNAVADPEYKWAGQQAAGEPYPTILAVPMLREATVIGVLTVQRTEVRPFTDKQIELVTTFADQAVIAIENVRLFNETKEALEQQTATGEILRVIASSPTDLQPVMEAIAENAARVCGATLASIFRLTDGVLGLNAVYGPVPTFPDGRGGELRVDRGSVTGRAVVERRTIHIEDVAALPEEEFPETRAVQQRFGQRTTLATPLLREGQALGAILIRRTEVKPFTNKQIALLETFADQAVIAIENVRLFTELRERTTDLTRSVDQLTALGEVSRAVSSTLDVETVLQTIVMRANQLAGTAGCTSGSTTSCRRSSDYAPATTRTSATPRFSPRPAGLTTIPKGQGVTTQVMERQQPVQIADIAVEGTYESPVRHALMRRRAPGAARGALGQRGRGHRGPGRHQQDPGRIRAGDRPAA